MKYYMISEDELEEIGLDSEDFGLKEILIPSIVSTKEEVIEKIEEMGQISEYEIDEILESICDNICVDVENIFESFSIYDQINSTIVDNIAGYTELDNLSDDEVDNMPDDNDEFWDYDPHDD